jgi:hypothetical protein
MIENPVPFQENRLFHSSLPGAKCNLDAPLCFDVNVENDSAEKVPTQQPMALNIFVGAATCLPSALNKAVVAK